MARCFIGKPIIVYKAENNHTFLFNKKIKYKQKPHLLCFFGCIICRVHLINVLPQTLSSFYKSVELCRLVNLVALASRHVV